MSKMSQIHADLTEQASELGFSSIEEAEANGFHIDYTSKGWKLKLDMAKAYEQARKEWEQERDTLLTEAGDLLESTENFEPTAYDDLRSMVRSLIEFIKKGEI